ncbi:MAG TPA: hypothetical protein VER79_14090 [Candidatus Limnocylindrales bacterium]|nr:hypothetical protein [Candidatus Limnocylindrales bacterium]
MALFSFPDSYRQRLRYWLPAFVAGAISWLLFILIGQTPVIRASGLALVIVAMALTLRPYSSALAVLGALALAFSPAFWSQTGGSESLNPAAILAALGLTAGVIVLGVFSTRRFFWAVALGVGLFALLFLLVVGAPRSLRLTTLVTAWMLYLLLDGLLLSNPRPDSPPIGRLGAHHTYGLLLLFTIGVVNDPLVVLMAPALLLGLFLTSKRMPVLYWLALIAVTFYGVAGVVDTYSSAYWWQFSSERGRAMSLTVPYLLGDGWRNAHRWVDMAQLIANQFTIVGVALGVFGLARLSRWYPPVGVVTMVAYGMYGLFGLVYFGSDAPVLLLPMLMIQVIWMTYAVYGLGQWLQKSAGARTRTVRWLAPAAYFLLPAVLLLRVVNAG